MGSRTPIVLGVLASLTATPSAIAQWVPPYWQIERLGLFDAEHTSATGVQDSYAKFAVDDGVVMGYSRQYTSSPHGAGRSAWVWSRAAGTRRLGFLDATHTDSFGHRYSEPWQVRDETHLTGVSRRFDGTSDRGQSMWFDGGTGPTRVGPADAEHTRADGYQYGSPWYLNPAGQVVGTSNRFSAMDDMGVSTWAWTPTQGLALMGLTDAEHTRGDGYRESYPFTDSRITNLPLSRVVGTSDRYIGAAHAGYSAWTWTPNSGVMRLGFIDALHTRADGFRDSRVGLCNAAGVVLGGSTAFLSPSESGVTAWAWTESGGTVRVGLTDPEHTSPTGTQSAYAMMLNASGLIMGVSRQYSNPAREGQSAWAWTAPGGHRRLGFIDAAHTGTGGLRTSEPVWMNDDGLILGFSKKFGGTIDLGNSLWIDAGQGPVRIGLTDALHTRADGKQHGTSRLLDDHARVIGSSEHYAGFLVVGASAWVWSAATGTVEHGLADAMHTSPLGGSWNGIRDVNASGQVAGTSTRFSAAGYLGQDGWFFDPQTNTTTPLVFSVRTDGFAETTCSWLTDQGWVIGTYKKFSGASFISTNAFLWSRDRGFIDAGELLNGGFGAHGWAAIDDWPNQPVGVITVEGRVLSNSGTTIGVLIPPPSCYANCDASTIQPVLNVADFVCFLNRYSAADPYANCDGSVTPPILNIADFTCFLIVFAAGCS
ncbi:MAG: GC-type dockerin domain-anchored protein [Phycisphaerales bacterium]